jgi:inosine-uridine nucleoside N-ribohydrolase
MASIPRGLSPSESEVYQELIRVGQQREERGQCPRPIVVITDPGLDYDDLAALAVLKELHRLGLVELRAVVANLMPAEKRARFAKAALNSLGLIDVPVACGTHGSPEEHQVMKHELESHEVELSWNVSVAPEDISQQDGQDLLLEVYENAKAKGEKLHLLCLSSLQDIHQFASAHAHLVVECTSEVHMQSGNYISEEGNLEPDVNAATTRIKGGLQRLGTFFSNILVLA